MKSQKCKYMKQATTWQEREVGCPLDHCQCGTHDPHHDCEPDQEDEEIKAAELAAGWDPNP